MRIAHVLSSFELGGQERVALDLASAQRAAGDYVLAASLAPRGQDALADAFRAAGVEVLHVGRAGGFDTRLVARLAFLFASRHIEVVHTHNPRAMVYGAPAGKLVRAVVVHSKHGVNPDPLRRRQLRRAAAMCVDAYVAVVQSLADVARDGHECSPNRLHVIPNGIDLSRFGPDSQARRAIRDELGLSDDVWVVGTVGRLAPEKDHALLIRATAALRDRGAHLVIVGEGPERPSLLGAPGVHLVGVRSDVPRWLAAFDVFALSSKSEGLPLALIEAMATELPAVATQVGGVGDLLEHSVTGLLVPASDPVRFETALTTLAHDRALARAMGREGRRRVLARHSAASMASAYQAVYRALLAAPRLGHVGIRSRRLAT